MKLVNGSVRLQWPSVPGRAYRVEASADGVAWSTVVDWSLATSSTMSHTTPAAGVAGQNFFRVQVRP